MDVFLQPLEELKEFGEIKGHLAKKQTPIQVMGCIESQKSHLIAGLGKQHLYKIIITYDELKAKEIYEDYQLYDKNVFLYPAKDAIFYSADIHGNAIVKDRIIILKRLIQQLPTTIITTINAGMDKVLPLDFLRKSVISIQEGSLIKMNQLSIDLVHLGYERVGQVERPGEFAIRGGIIDLFSLIEEYPYRIELWDDEVDSIRSFDVLSQRSIERIDEIQIYQASELILDEATILSGMKIVEKEKEEQIKLLRSKMKTEEANRLNEIVEELKENLKSFHGAIGIDSYISYFYQNTISFFDYFLGEESIFYLDEPNRIIEKGDAVEFEFRESMIGRLEKGYILPKQMDVIYSYKELLGKIALKQSIWISTMDYKIPFVTINYKYEMTVKSVNSYQNNFEVLIKELAEWSKRNYRVVLLSNSRTRAKRLSQDLRNYDLNAIYSEDRTRKLVNGEIMVSTGSVHRGFEYPMIKYIVLAENDIFGAEKKKRRKKVTYEGKKIQNFTDLHIGDYVVHENHGLGIYKGIEKIEVDKVVKDYIKIEYDSGGILYILATGLDIIQKYAGSEIRKPKLNKLNSLEWKKTKNKVRTAVKEIAKELVQLYAVRQSKTGYQFSIDTVWQAEFEELFPYEETEDQIIAIEATKKDMQSKKIMDRLICGDVGYGKTEIAIRAAFKAVMDGKQVVFLVPTTILAQQHYNTFSQRMKDFPICVDVLSRFKSTAEQKKLIEKLKTGNLDIVISTHRILSKDIKFKDLGLLIIDEEQRFGVTHKEKIKQLKSDVDVLTLSATPIPRTLHMSLIGIRDMSVLEEPPIDRMPIQTYVLEHNDEIIREAINRELGREGQVYYVYNRVDNIDEVAMKLASLVPEAHVSFAHGQMKEKELERIMFHFINGEIDVLVATTIIETGLDISNVNTMIIDDADRLGLSQLYQLRGRVGRSNRTAYAFLMYKRDKMLKEIAEKRLQAIKEFTELGSGFKIAMRDLEIRGAGNLLGAKQHGHMEAVGYDLYCKMLNEAVKEYKGERFIEEDYDTMVDIDLDAYIPNDYIKNEFQKLDMYKRIADIQNEQEFLDIQEELIDRFGNLPTCVNNLLHISLIKEMAHTLYITQIIHKQDQVKLVMYEKANIKVEKIDLLLEKYHSKLIFTANKGSYFLYRLEPENKSKKLERIYVIDCIKTLLTNMREIL